MANAVVTFSRTGTGTGGSYAPLVDATCRTENVAIGGGNAISELEARSSENVVSVLAEADCWVSVGSEPDATIAEAGSNRRPLLAGREKEFTVRQGHRVAVTTKA